MSERRDHYEDPLLRAMVDDDLIATGPAPAIVAANQPLDDVLAFLADNYGREGIGIWVQSYVNHPENRAHMLTMALTQSGGT